MHIIKLMLEALRKAIEPSVTFWKISNDEFSGREEDSRTGVGEILGGVVVVNS